MNYEPMKEIANYLQQPEDEQNIEALEKIEDFRNKGGNVDFGAFGENLVIEGFELNKLPVGQRLTIGEEVLLEVTQIGKECHDKCAIYYQVGECIMPKNGIFTRVLKGGKVKVGDEATLVKNDKKKRRTVYEGKAFRWRI